MLMKAMDTLHVSAVGPDNIQPGQTKAQRCCFALNDFHRDVNRLLNELRPHLCRGIARRRKKHGRLRQLPMCFNDDGTGPVAANGRVNAGCVAGLLCNNRMIQQRNEAYVFDDVHLDISVELLCRPVGARRVY